MISQIGVFFRSIRRAFSRSRWAIRLLRLPQLEHPSRDPGLVMVQIDGLSLTEFNRALQKDRVPFLNHLLRRERHILHSFYSGLPSNTPAVQAELFYGMKTCVPAFSFVDRRLGRAVKMFDAAYVEEFEPRLKEHTDGLLAGGSSYSNIFTGGAKEAHFCWAKLGWGGVLHAVNPLVFPFLVILYLDIFIRTAALLVIEFFLAVFDCIRGALKGRVLAKELELIWVRVLVCVFLRELITVGACMDVARGLPVVHLNFLGYDEQAHCRGPSSSFAHWSLRGIDHCIRRIHAAMKHSQHREYDLWVYADHGQEKTTPYPVAHGRTIEEAVEELFGLTPVPPAVRRAAQNRAGHSRAHLLRGRKTTSVRESVPSTIDFAGHPVVVAAMGPLGHVYVNKKMEKEELAFYARKMVAEVKIPLVMMRAEPEKILAFTSKGSFVLPEQAAEVFGKDHPFLEEIRQDIGGIVYHPDAGELVMAGWCEGAGAISFPLEFGAHAGMGFEETRAFALLPMDAPLKSQEKAYLRPKDLRAAAQSFLNKETSGAFCALPREAVPMSLRLMSYNVHGCLGMDGYISTERIARVIARHHPDVISLQELDVGRPRSKGMDQVGKIAKVLEMKYHFHPAICRQEEQYGNAILSRYPMALIKMEALPQMKEKYEPRGAMWVGLDFQGTQIQIINTHLSIWPRERLLQINALLGPDWLGHSDCYGPVILCGDFNALPGSTVYRKICQRLKDSQAILSGHRPHRTWFGHYPLTQIDYIFVTSEFQVNSIAVPRTSLDKVASDHLPLIVDLKFVEGRVSLNPASPESM